MLRQFGKANTLTASPLNVQRATPSIRIRKLHLIVGAVVEWATDRARRKGRQAVNVSDQSGNGGGVRIRYDFLRWKRREPGRWSVAGHSHSTRPSRHEGSALF